LHKVRAVEFGLLKSEEVERMSVVKIMKERIYDDLGNPMLNAINDPRMGTMDKELRCYTCKGSK
jgi:DNA-directed RNA polymerase II subunit RPB1